MGRMNIYLDDDEDKKIERLKDRFNIKSKEDVIKRLIKQFPEPKDNFSNDFDISKETNIEDLI
jgi:protocatechuate 3,4-dioxygenase beta subunit